ncbi:Integral membrane protein [hydrothermal vent metagenome]|uniref:Integral membrane protein n=1 Tax=hydrothermal vent metagenome TaxID=652676 RepID=A0A3B0YGQ3_9ZZZZ
MEYFLDAFKRYADFSGRATRQQYWMFILFYFIGYIVLAVIDGVLGTFVLAILYSLVLLVPSISIAARRLHDTGRTGWWQLISLIPLIGIIVMIVFLVQDSQEDNEYGPKPAPAVAA